MPLNYCPYPPIHPSMPFPSRFSSPQTTLTTSTISPVTTTAAAIGRNVLLLSTYAPVPALPRVPTRLSVANSSSRTDKWRNRVSFFPSFPSFLKKKGKDRETLKKELIDAITPLDRGAEATPEDQEQVGQRWFLYRKDIIVEPEPPSIVRELEAINSIKEPLKSKLLNGKWELIYTTSRSILKSQWPNFIKVTANLVPLSSTRVAVKFETFKILGLIPVKAPGSNRGELEITYLDDELRTYGHVSQAMDRADPGTNENFHINGRPESTQNDSLMPQINARIEYLQDVMADGGRFSVPVVTSENMDFYRAMT
ncbi:hypothetical protein ACLOJK_013869 [Asimina triloba]